MPELEISLVINADEEQVRFKFSEHDGIFYSHKAFHQDHPFGEMKSFEAGFVGSQKNKIFCCGCGLRVVVPSRFSNIDILKNKFSAFNTPPAAPSCPPHKTA